MLLLRSLKIEFHGRKYNSREAIPLGENVSVLSAIKLITNCFCPGEYSDLYFKKTARYKQNATLNINTYFEN